MAVEVKMPQLGLTMEEGTVSKWVKQEGDAVKVGDVLLEITTDKLTSEVTAEAEGTLIKIVAQEGEDVPVKGSWHISAKQASRLEQHPHRQHPYRQPLLRQRKSLPAKQKWQSSAAAPAVMLRQSERHSWAAR